MKLWVTRLRYHIRRLTPKDLATVSIKRMIILLTIVAIIGTCSGLLAWSHNRQSNRRSTDDTGQVLTQKQSNIAPAQSENANKETVKSPEPKPSVAQSQSPKSVAASSPPSASTPRATAPPPGAFKVVAVNFSPNTYCYNQVSDMTPSNTYIQMQNINSSGGTVQWRWEYRGDYTDLAGVDTSSYAEQVAGDRSMVFPGGGSMPGYGRIYGYSSGGFGMRLHVLAPNDMASSWTDAPPTDCP